MSQLFREQETSQDFFVSGLRTIGTCDQKCSFVQLGLEFVQGAFRPSSAVLRQISAGESNLGLMFQWPSAYGRG